MLPIVILPLAVRYQKFNVFVSSAGEAETPVDMETISLDPEAEVKADFCPYGLYTAGRKR